MKIATTTGDFAIFLDNDADKLRELHRAGFKHIDFNMYRFSPASVYMNDGWREEVYRIKQLAESLGMTFVQAHSQRGNPLSDDLAHADFIKKATIRSIEICEILGIKNTVAHTGHAPDIDKEEYFARAKAFYETLLPTAERCGVNVLCENSPRMVLGNRHALITGKDMRDFVKYVDHPNFHACWDTGHANIVGSQYDEIMDIGDELYAIHYNDNHGKSDDHIAPFLGRMNHDEVICALIDVGYKGYFTLECDSSLIEYNKWTGERRRFERSGKLREPQLFMQRHIEAMMYDTAKWMLEEYGIFDE